MMADADVEQWKGLCRKLNAMNNRLHMALDNAVIQRLKADDKCKIAEAKTDGLELQVQELKAENEKLRHLCLIAHRWMDRALYDGSVRRYEYESITECMRELGIEVMA